MLEASIVFLQVAEDEADHTNNLLFVREIKNLRDVLNNVESEITEEVHGELVVAKNPEGTDDVVCNLGVLLALVNEKFLEDHEAALMNELFR